MKNKYYMCNICNNIIIHKEDMIIDEEGYGVHRSCLEEREEQDQEFTDRMNHIGSGD